MYLHKYRMQVKFILDNKNQLNCLDFDKEEKRTHSNTMPSMYNVEVLRDLGFNFCDYADFLENKNNSHYYYPVFLRHPFDCFNINQDIISFIPLEIRGRISINEIKLVFLIIDEAFNILNDRRAINKYLDKLALYNISNDNVHWILSSKAINSPVIKNKHFYNLFLATMSYTINKTPEVFVNDYNIDKHFICLNSQPKLHRQYLVYRFILDNLLDKGIVSANKTFDCEISYLDNTETHIRPFLENWFGKEKIECIENQLPLVADSPSRDLLTVFTRTNIDLDLFLHLKELYTRAAVCLVTETANTTHDVKFITEKTTKAIAFKMPFIISGEPGFLEHLKSLGFETFPEIFNESYDTISDLKERNEIIIEEIKVLCNYKLNNLHNIVNQIKNKLEYNFNHLKNFNNIIMADLIKGLM